MSGLLINGQLYPVRGVTVIGPNEAKWAHLDPGDGCHRDRKPQQFTIHKTLADDPEHVLSGAGPAGGAEATAEYWQQDPRHSGAHIVVGHDGVTACLADLHTWMAYHARSVNPYSVGMEIKERLGGGVYQAALDAAVQVALTACELLGIQFQCQRVYRGRPLNRMRHPESMIGLFGHRDNDSDRGQWDPGDIVFDMLRMRGVESYDFDAGEDIVVWKGRQKWLNLHGANLVVDGIPGPATTAALKTYGYRSGIWALGKTV